MLVVPVFPDHSGATAVLGQPGLILGSELSLDLAAYLARDDASGRAGELVSVPVLPNAPAVLREILLVGLGASSAIHLGDAGAAVGRRLRSQQQFAVLDLAAADENGQRAFLESMLLAGYAFSGTDRQADRPKSKRVTLVGEWDDRAVERAQLTARSTFVARDLANTPPNVKTPQWLAGEALRLGRAAGLTVNVLRRPELERAGFGGLLGVGAGSVHDPVLVTLEYVPPRSAKRADHVVLVGKGITFDTGGLSLKPNDAMKMMKTDMAGAGAVLAAMTELPVLGQRARVTGLLPLAENMPSGSAMRPSDVLRMYDGTTVEVLNTDAEGRLILADALGYAVRKLRPDVVVDVATLTGAASVGLGRRHAALFTPVDALADQFVAAGDASGDRVWRMPLDEDLRSSLDSSIADIAHVPTNSRTGGGAITAALFLQRFVADVPWAHLDIAGPARADSDEREVTRGATGFGARLLLRWLEKRPARR